MLLPLTEYLNRYCVVSKTNHYIHYVKSLYLFNLPKRYLKIFGFSMVKATYKYKIIEFKLMHDIHLYVDKYNIESGLHTMLGKMA